ncbi:hypothetical protein DLM85_14855 [Hymenobacter edaphi]|uniref:Uncharacterized protein n=1 Tax=Hymenobacter edaphi TaxID=2211146 RepID=A0A328BJ89_9BACT|nr:hypothetical protein DLM85_14855 [Hymenobacter edaphi]
MTAEVIFHPEPWLRFPIRQPLRLSLWPAAKAHSVPAEFQIQEPVQAGTAYVLQIETLLAPVLEDLMQPGAAILFGTPPTRIAGEGRILSIEPKVPGPAVWVSPKTLNGPI